MMFPSWVSGFAGDTRGRKRGNLETVHDGHVDADEFRAHDRGHAGGRTGGDESSSVVCGHLIERSIHGIGG